MTDIPYRLVRSRRRTLALVITRQGTLEVRAPLRLSPQAIEEFVDQKRDWIAARMAERERVVLPPFRWGDTVPFWGREVPVLPGEEACFDSGRFFLPQQAAGDWVRVRKALEPLYRKEAKACLSCLTEREVLRTGWNGGKVPPVRITGARTRWGSCSGRNSLNFSWRLMAAGEEEVRYVVIHELAHTQEHNHSPRFWALVEKACPAWRERRDQLRITGLRLEREGWND